MAIIIYVIVAVVALVLVLIARSWIIIYNKFQYWRNKAEKRFAGQRPDRRAEARRNKDDR